MTLYTDGETPATEPEILSAASAIMQGRRKNPQNAGRKPVLTKDQQRIAGWRLAAGESVNAVAKDYGVSWATVAKLRKCDV